METLGNMAKTETAWNKFFYNNPDNNRTGIIVGRECHRDLASMPECSMEGVCKPVPLEPFVHQVGGHSSVLRLDERTLCKPLIHREKHFYENMPKELKKFTPHYRGVIEVTYHEDSDGYMTLVAYPPPCEKEPMIPEAASSSPSSGGEGTQSDSDSDGPLLRVPTQQRFRMRRTGSVKMEGFKGGRFVLVDSEEESEGARALGYNPWSLQCHKEQLVKMRAKNDASGSHKFILLENLTSHFELPCILDLKMGRRQHGDDASDDKRHRQIHKCETTTSNVLGIRICGMQVYNTRTQSFTCQDKYFGRRLDAAGAQETLNQFLYNGYNLCVELIDPILERLHKLHALLSKENTFRFYSSSLLVMYDAADWYPDSIVAEQCRPGHNQRSHQDSSSSSSSYHEFSNHDSAHDNTLDGGLLYPRNSSQGNSESRSKEQPNSDWSDRQSGYSQNSEHCRIKLPKPKVDVRMIDFAHVTFEGFRGDRIVHKGPDHGYLFGLETLIKMFEKIKRTAAQSSRP